MRFRIFEVGNQREALQKLAELTQRNVLSPMVRTAAIAITQDCPNEDDECELQAIFDAVKTGDPRVAGMERGFRYVSDPRAADYFTGAERNLKLCKSLRSCGGDCDDHACLVAALAGSIGFKVGLRAWGPPDGDYEHVYAVVAMPKSNSSHVLGMDTTTRESFLGWEPPRGRVLTAWLD